MARTDTLGNFLTDVAEAIREKEGTTGTIPASEFDTRISNLSSGGDGSSEEIPSDITQLGPVINNVIVKQADAIVDKYQTYTNEPVTLYTPNAEYKNYVIRNRSGSYGIVWLKPCYFMKIYNGTFYTVTLRIDSFASSIDSFEMGSMRWREYKMIGYMANFSTLEECIEAIQNPNTVYTTSNESSGWTCYDESSELFASATNLPTIFGDQSYNVTLTLKSGRISSNETIKVIGE